MTVDIWTVSLSEPRPLVLSNAEKERAARFRFDGDRVRWANARSALRMVLAQYLSSPPDSFDFEFGEHGKPRVAGIEFNLSHAGDYGLIAVAGNVPAGVDIERIRPEVDMAALLTRLGEKDLPATRPELFQRWTRREAASKAGGGMLMADPGDGPRVADLNAPPGYCAAVALLGADPVVEYRSL